jgi:hypothetical protein
MIIRHSKCLLKIRKPKSMRYRARAKLCLMALATFWVLLVFDQ